MIAAFINLFLPLHLRDIQKQSINYSQYFLLSGDSVSVVFPGLLSLSGSYPTDGSPNDKLSVTQPVCRWGDYCCR